MAHSGMRGEEYPPEAATDLIKSDVPKETSFAENIRQTHEHLNQVHRTIQAINGYLELSGIKPEESQKNVEPEPPSPTTITDIARINKFQAMEATHRLNVVANFLEIQLS